MSASLALLSGGRVLAQDPADNIEDLSLDELMNASSSTVMKRLERVQDTPGSVTVITRHEIGDMNAQTLREVLNVFVPGLDVVPTYFRYGDRVNEGIYSRGLLSDFSQQILILFNGQTKFNETTWGSPFVPMEYTLENVERIEVSRSPVPIYGGSAFTVINIVTREQHLDDAGEIHVNVGVNERDGFRRGVQAKKITAMLGHKLGSNWHISGSAQFYDDFGQAHRSAQGKGTYAEDLGLSSRTLRDGTKEAASFTLSLKSKDEKLTVQTMYRYINRDAYLSALLPSPSQDQYFYKGKTWLAQATYRPTSSLRLLASAQTFSWSNFYDFAGTPAGGAEDNYGLSLEANHTLVFHAAGEHSLVSGVRIEREGQHRGAVFTWDPMAGVFREDNQASAIFAPNVSRTIPAAFIEDSWKPSDKVSVLAGARADYYVGFGDKKELTLAPRFALLFTPRSDLILKGLYAAAARPPAIYERLGANAVPLKGNPATRSERVDTGELTAIYRARHWKAQVTAFLELYRHKIEYLSDANGAQVAQNNGDTRAFGADLELRHYFTPANYLFANGTWLRSHDLRNDHQTYFLPSLYLSGGGNVRWRRLNVNLTGYFRDSRPLADDLEINRKNSGYTLRASTSISYHVTDTLKVHVSVENVTGQVTNIPLSADNLFVRMRSRTYFFGLAYHSRAE